MDEMHKIRKVHKDYGCLRMTRELRARDYLINKKKVERLMRENGLNVTSYTRKSRKYSSYKRDTESPKKSSGSTFQYTHRSSKNYHRYD